MYMFVSDYFFENTMKGFILTTIFVAALLVNDGVLSKKMVVTYLGTDHILPGGCPVHIKGGFSGQQERERIFNDCM